MNRDKIAQLLKEQSMFVQEATPRITTKIVPCSLRRAMTLGYNPRRAQRKHMDDRGFLVLHCYGLIEMHFHWVEERNVRAYFQPVKEEFITMEDSIDLMEMAHGVRDSNDGDDRDEHAPWIPTNCR